ncbi:BlaI/MecI/CopY family transcriptional regulator [Actinoplanes oblitus]|uniref:BlaI/MecI/CopY family transcriptional regulator n=1 Tax=Actinoplanes oblitus TaxID=3040509 RepID=A0ABY8W8H7_9ACTN|nr:BlaI/MecI/CopY family transcriptional regulator [Actinoplanes oblitus]WIM93282.1 BlaI/MecI/CopY family transcriptional regulator [Actinoplanes oblitus]
MSETRGRRRPGQLETEIMTVLGRADRPLTPGEVRDLLDPTGELSYSTVVTTLTRLYEKGSASRHRDGRAFRYGAPDGPAGLVADRMSRLLAVEADRASVLRRFVGNLDARDEQLLRDLLGE